MLRGTLCKNTKHSMVEKLEGEEWRDIAGYEGLYQVSNCGRVKSLGRYIRAKAGSSKWQEEKLLRPATTRDGYLLVGLCKNGQRKMFLVHRLVATVFIPNPMPLFYTDINHKDECKTNNAASNLEWCDTKYNANYGTRNERMAAAQTNGKQSKRVGQFNLAGTLIKEWPSTNECGRNGYSCGNVAACCNNKYHRVGNNIYKGYIWKYLE